MSNTLVQNYAKAFWGSIANHPEAPAMMASFGEIGQAFKNDEILAFFSSPVFSSEQKLKAVEAVFKDKLPSDLFAPIRLLAEKDRLGFLPEICDAMVSLKNESLGIKQGVVYSAVDLSKDEIQKIETVIGLKIKSKVLLHLKIDNEIKAGVRVEVDGWTFDDGLDFHELKLTEYLKRS